MNLPELVSRPEWLAARQALLEREKELAKMRDALNADRRRLPVAESTRTTPSPSRTVRPASPTCSATAAS